MKTNLVERRLEIFLKRKYPKAKFSPVTGDASARCYFRITMEADRSYIAAVYPLPYEKHYQTFLLTTEFFKRFNLPVPTIIDESGADGIIMQEDFGRQMLSGWLKEASPKQLEMAIKKAIDLIITIQQTTNKAKLENNIVTRLEFNFDKFLWELQYFFIHYLTYFKKTKISHKVENQLFNEFNKIAYKLADGHKQVVHRDFHIDNLMVLNTSPFKLGMIDYQDARLGPISYDLVPLLVERLRKPLSDDEVDAFIDYFLSERIENGLQRITKNDFYQNFWLMDLQRGLKVLGTFGYMSAVMQKESYERFIPGALNEIKRALKNVSQPFPNIKEILELR